jgi:hypothetical protein
MKNTLLTKAEAQRAVLTQKVTAVNAQNKSFNDACAAVHEQFARFVGQKVANTSKSAQSLWVKKTGLGEMLESVRSQRFEEGPLCSISVNIATTGRSLYLEHKVRFEINGRTEYRQLDWYFGTCNTESWINEPADGVLQELNQLPAKLRVDWTVDEVINLRLELDHAENKVTEARAALAQFCR